MSVNGFHQHTLRAMNTTGQTIHLMLALICMAGANYLHAQNASSDAAAEAEYQKKVHAETLRLMESARPSDRAAAAERLAGLYADMNYSLLWKLMNDTDPGVRLTAITALTSFTCTMRYNISFELAQKIAAMLEKEVTAERIAAARDAARADMQPEAKIRQIRMVTRSARALSWLHGEHTLKSPRKNFAWYHAMGPTLFEAMAHHLSDAAGTYDELIYELRYGINEPEDVVRALHLTLENLKLADISAERQLAALGFFWNDSLLGENKPMNLLLLKELNPVWAVVKAHLVSHAKETSDEQRALYYVGRIDEAYAEARKQLGPQTDVKGSK